MVVFGLGGTIGMCSTDGGAVTPALSARQLVDAVLGLAATGIEIEVTDCRRRPGASLTFADLTELAAAANQVLAAGAAGVVVTQGTGTIEETAYDSPTHRTPALPIPPPPGNGPAPEHQSRHCCGQPSSRRTMFMIVSIWAPPLIG